MPYQLWHTHCVFTLILAHNVTQMCNIFTNKCWLIELVHRCSDNGGPTVIIQSRLTTMKLTCVSNSTCFHRDQVVVANATQNAIFIAILKISYVTKTTFTEYYYSIHRYHVSPYRSQIQINTCLVYKPGFSGSQRK